MITCAAVQPNPIEKRIAFCVLNVPAQKPNAFEVQLMPECFTVK